jgi:hypothetical protein
MRKISYEYIKKLSRYRKRDRFVVSTIDGISKSGYELVLLFGEKVEELAEKCFIKYSN